MPKKCLNTRRFLLRPLSVVDNVISTTDEVRSPKRLVFKQLFGTFIPVYNFYLYFVILLKRDITFPIISHY